MQEIFHCYLLLFPLYFRAQNRICQGYVKEGLISKIEASLRDMFPKIFRYGAKTGRRAILSLTAQVDKEDESNPCQSDRFFNDLF